jgi:hypothetical protein
VQAEAHGIQSGLRFLSVAGGGAGLGRQAGAADSPRPFPRLGVPNPLANTAGQAW